MEEICKAVWSKPLAPAGSSLTEMFLITYPNIVLLSKIVSLQYSALEDYSTAPSIHLFCPSWLPVTTI